jgi:hypothetical protein
MATVGEHPDGLVRRPDLPAAAPMPLSVRARRGISLSLVDSAAQSLRTILAA